MTDETKSELSILALGGGAGKIGRLVADTYSSRWLQIAYLDTDVRDLDFVDGVLQVPLGQEWTRDQGCGDDPVLGQHAAEASIEAIREAIGETKMLLVMTCLGGGLGSGAAATLARLAKEMELMSFFLVSLPMAGEGNGPRQIAENALRQLRSDADVVVAVPNDLLFNQLPTNTPAGDAFALANQVFADGLIGLAELARCRGIIPLDFSSMKTVLKGREAHCSIGIGRASGEGKAAAAVEMLFQSPLLGGKEYVSRADAVIGTLVGGTDMALGDLNQCLAQVNEHLSPTTRSFLGANLVPERGDEMQLTLLAVHYQKAEAPASLPRNTRPNRGLAPALDGTRQFKLPFVEEAGSLGIFDDSTATTHLGENLDIPTYLRRGITLDLEAP